MAALRVRGAHPTAAPRSLPPIPLHTVPVVGIGATEEHKGTAIRNCMCSLSKSGRNSLRSSSGSSSRSSCRGSGRGSKSSSGSSSTGGRGGTKSNSAGSEDVPCTSSETGRPVLGSLGAQSPSHQNYSTITIHLWLPQLICPSRLYSLSPTSCSLPGRHLAVNASVPYLQFTAAALFLSSAHLS